MNTEKIIIANQASNLMLHLLAISHKDFLLSTHKNGKISPGQKTLKLLKYKRVLIVFLFPHLKVI